jgi:hypothetical protein
MMCSCDRCVVLCMRRGGLLAAATYCDNRFGAISIVPSLEDIQTGVTIGRAEDPASGLDCKQNSHAARRLSQVTPCEILGSDGNSMRAPWWCRESAKPSSSHSSPIQEMASPMAYCLPHFAERGE